MKYDNLLNMSEDMSNISLCVTLTPQIIAKIDERATLTGLKRQDIIKEVMAGTFFPVE